MLAAGRALPQGILTSDAAARLGYAPDHRVETVVVALGHRRRDVPGYCFSQRRIPAELITERDRIRLTVPALTALDLTGTSGGEAIDDVLRRRAATLAGLRQALELSANRRGNSCRRRLLLDSRDEPWSAAERKFHWILRLLGYTGWRANYRIVLAARAYYLDVAFPAQRVAIEIDGRLFHCDPAIFESDRHRQNQIVAAGWRVIRLTWTMLDDLDNVTAILRSVLENPHRALVVAP